MVTNSKMLRIKQLQGGFYDGNVEEMWQTSQVLKTCKVW